MVLENATAVFSTVDINYLFGSLANILALSAVTIGVLFQTIIKWWDKWQDGQPIPFDRKFIGTAISAFVGALIVAIPLLNAGSEVLNANIPIYGLIIAWFVTAGWAYALNNGINGVVTKVYSGAENRLIKSGRLDALIDERIALRKKELESIGFTQDKNNSGTEVKDNIIGGSEVTQP